MSAEEMIRRAKEIRERLRNPPNAVPDKVATEGQRRLPVALSTPPPIKGHPTTVSGILGAVSRHYGIGEKDLLGRSRRWEISHPRQVAIYLMSNQLALTPTEVGKVFGFDRSSCAYARDKVAADLNKFPVNNILTLLTEGVPCGKPSD